MDRQTEVDAKDAELQASPAVDQLSGAIRMRAGNRFWRRLFAEKKALIGLAVVILLGIVAAIGPYLTPYDPMSQQFALFQAPTLAHPMGTDSFGRDVFSRIIVGARVSFTIGISAALLAMIGGVTLGLVSGYYGGWIDSVIMRFIDLVWAFPVIILTIGLVAIFGAGARNVVIAIAIAYLDDFARVVRSEVLSLREEDFTLAARAVGAPDIRVIFRHILPNTAAPIIVQATFAVGLGILAEAALSFLGLGVQPSTPTWGLALNESRDFIQRAWWMSVFPGLAIVLTVLSLNLFGDGLRDALDVRSVGE